MHLKLVGHPATRAPTSNSPGNGRGHVGIHGLIASNRKHSSMAVRYVVINVVTLVEERVQLGVIQEGHSQLILLNPEGVERIFYHLIQF